MTGANATLRAVIAERYEYLVEHLQRVLRSKDLARDALHEAYLRFDNARELNIVGNPVGFVLRSAVNISRDKQRSERRQARRVSGGEIDAALHIADDTPGPGRSAEAKSDWQLLEKALAEMPERRRNVLLMSYGDKASAAEIAKCFGKSTRWVNHELRLAREYCAWILANNPKK